MIKLTNINKYYKSSSGQFHALKDITLTLPDQGMVYIVGKSGSGKSTLLNVIGGIDSYDSGQLIIENNAIEKDSTITTSIVDVNKFSKKDYNSYRNTYIGFIFQEFNVIKGLTVYENIALSLRLQQKSIREKHIDILNIIEKVGLKGKEKRRINELSGGERQRVAIARALIKDPKVIIADEPTGNLDSKNRDIVMNILKELSREKLVLIVTHDKYLSRIYGDREIKIKDGAIVSDQIINPHNLSNIVPTYHKITPISPKATVSLDLAWKGFKLNIARFIFIILLFSISLIFAGTVINLYLTDTTKTYAQFQQENDNFVITLSEKFNYFGTEQNTGFFSYSYNNAQKHFIVDDTTKLNTYKNMQVEIPIKKVTEDVENTKDNLDKFSSYFFKENINNITIVENDKAIENNFDLLYSTVAIKPDFPCYITDYLAYSLNNYKYYNGKEIFIGDLLGKEIDVPGSKTPYTIVGIINTNFINFYNLGDEIFNNNNKQATFEDNLAIYNSIFVSESTYKDFYSSSNINYFYDDIIYHSNDENKTFGDVKFTFFQSKEKTPILKGEIPKKPEQGEITEVAISKGYVEKILGLSVDQLRFSGSSKLILDGSVAKTFYICGYSRIPAQLEFNVTAIIDCEEVVIYTPSKNESTLYTNLISSSFKEGGYITAIITDDIETNSTIYRNLLTNNITINNPSFLKLQLVDEFINDNLFLFAALFFIFCLFSILMIFNFIIINIKNSTRDIGIYMSLGMNGFKISLIYLFQILIVSTISMIIGIIGSTIILYVIDSSFNSQVLVIFNILNITFLGTIGIILLAYVTPFVAIASPLFGLSRKKPIDVIKIS